MQIYIPHYLQLDTLAIHKSGLYCICEKCSFDNSELHKESTTEIQTKKLNLIPKVCNQKDKTKVFCVVQKFKVCICL